MKKYILSAMVSLFLVSGVCAQTGVYMTYDDFKNGKLIKADGDKIGVGTMKKEVSLKVNGENKVFQSKEIFAIIIDGRLYRFAVDAMGNIGARITTVSDNYVFWRYNENAHYMAAMPLTSQGWLDYVSKGIDGPLYSVKSNGDLDKLATHKEFKALVDCIRGGKKLSMMHPLMMAVSECIAKDPTYKKDPKDATPPVK